jgi:RluA family pseudouridine synthase
VPDAVKLSSPATGEFWEIPILFEDDHLLVLNKPAGLLVSPDRSDPDRPSLMTLLHRAIERGAQWAAQRGLAYLRNAHRLDSEAGGVIVLVKNREALVSLAAQFATSEPARIYAALVAGSSAADALETDAKLAPHPLQMGVIRVDTRNGKRSHTAIAVRERFAGWMLLACRACPDRPHQIRVHLHHLRLPVVGDEKYGGRPVFLSALKPDYHQKRDQTERPLIARPALHAEEVTFNHPVTGTRMTLTAPWPKDMTVTVKYLKRYATATGPV